MSDTNGGMTVTADGSLVDADGSVLSFGYLCLRTEQIGSVLLADGWHDVEPQTFAARVGLIGTHGEHIVPGAAFVFTDMTTRTQTCGPLTSILAVTTHGEVLVPSRELP